MGRLRRRLSRRAKRDYSGKKPRAFPPDSLLESRLIYWYNNPCLPKDNLGHFNFLITCLIFS
ncbi:MAG: hypothetical protein COV72_07645 [Candidatus Omnitrophica bacterium CG11_big_fil_rev_8_21_14_0_20_42_13]|uniref:Uncharacterized protein n=1 Tax=Candidatus Ghiorseimicrobium undicola TaxID=1974746 RepID=A0A2H0LW66_9BACT|nr:MAG: hypothetical protein COV72_07645 [Candidatus Omnitrophica bacterium CG11_big_fil_rev_8_21_14_0_20_42_13]